MIGLSRRRALWLALAAFGLLRFSKWGAPLTSDEAYMLKHYASQPASYIAAHYEVPNNHVLLAIALREVDEYYPRKLIGTLNDIRPLQLVSILCSIATLPLTYAVARALLGGPAALLSVVFLGVSSWHLMYSHMLRGYSASTLLNTLNVWLLILLRRRRYWSAGPLALSLVAFHYIIPLNVVYSGASLGWLLFMLWRERGLAEREREERKKERIAVVEARQLKQRQAARKLDKIERDFEAQRRAESRRRAWLLGLLAAGMAASLGLTVYVYLPIYKQVLAQSRVSLDWLGSLKAVPARLATLVSTLGLTRSYRLAWLALALAGACWLWKRRRRRADLLALAAFVLLLPVAAATLQRNLPYARNLTVALPIWAMLAAAAVQGALVLARRRLGARPARLAWAAATLLVVAGSARELAAFGAWNRGLDLLGATRQALALAGGEDDFALVFCYEDRTELFGALDWEYYGFGSNLLPYDRERKGSDAPYLSRRLTVFAAPDEAAARACAAAGRLDRYALAALKKGGQAGGLGLFTAQVDDSVLAAYRGAPDDPQALTGLGADALRRGDLAGAERLLARAASLAPQDERAAFQLALGRYLARDPRAPAGFERALALDPQDAAARLYLADLAADARKPDAAAKLYLWYYGPEQTPDAWVYQDRVKQAVLALRAGRGPVTPDWSSPEKCMTTADAYAQRGSYELAAQALARSLRFRPWGVVEAAKAAEIAALARRYNDSERFSRQAVALGGGPGATYLLANALMLRGQGAQAREALAPLLAAYPNNPRLTEFWKTVSRL